VRERFLKTPSDLMCSLFALGDTVWSRICQSWLPFFFQHASVGVRKLTLVASRVLFNSALASPSLFLIKATRIRQCLALSLLFVAKASQCFEECDSA